MQCRSGAVVVQKWHGGGNGKNWAQIWRLYVALLGIPPPPSSKKFCNIATCHCHPARKESGLYIFYVPDFCHHSWYGFVTEARRRTLPCSLFLYSHLFPSSISSLSCPKAAFTKPLTKDDAKFCRAESRLLGPIEAPINFLSRRPWCAILIYISLSNQSSNNTIIQENLLSFLLWIYNGWKRVVVNETNIRTI